MLRRYVWNMVLSHAWDDVFGGGLWWTDDHSHGILGRGYKNAITNELFLYASASLCSPPPPSTPNINTAFAY